MTIIRWLQDHHIISRPPHRTVGQVLAEYRDIVRDWVGGA